MTKSIFLSSLIITLTVAFIAVNSIVSAGILKNIETELKEEKTTEEYKAIEKQFDKSAGYLSFFMSDSTILEIHSSLGEIIAYSEAGSDDEMEAAKNRLRVRLNEQRRLCGLNFKSIF